MSSDSPFLRAATGLLAGAIAARDFFAVLLREAGEDLLVRVSSTHGVPYEALIQLLPGVVESFTSLQTETECAQSTTRGRQCRKRAAVGGLCQQHAAAQADERSKRRRTAAYLAQRDLRATSAQTLVARCAQHDLPVPAVVDLAGALV